METVEQFFARLQRKNNWTDQGKIKAVLKYLKTEEINTVMVLKDMWEDIKSEMPLSLGMKIALEDEMRRM